MPPAVGNAAWCGVALDSVSPIAMVGYPMAEVESIAAPTPAITTADGGAGNITATVIHYVSYVKAGEAETAPSAGSTPLALVAKKADLTGIPTSGRTDIIRREIYRSHGTYDADGALIIYWVKTLYDDVTTTWTDDIAIDDERLLDSDGNILRTPFYRPVPLLDAPAAPVPTVSGVAGLVEIGVHGYAVSFVTAEGETLPSPIASVTIVDNAVAGKVNGTIPIGPDQVTARKIYRTKAGATALLLQQTVANNTATSWTLDNTADAGLGAAAPTQSTAWLNETGKNWGMRFEHVDQGTDLKRVDSPGETTEMTGYAGRARSIPGVAKFPMVLQQISRAGQHVIPLASALGVPTKQVIAGEPTRIYEFTKSYAQANSRSFSRLYGKGGAPDFRPGWFLNGKTSELAYKLAEGKAIDCDQKGMFTGRSRMNPAQTVSVTGTYWATKTAFLKGGRNAAHATEEVYLKITVAPSGGTFQFKCKLGSGGTYGSAITGYYDTATGLQTLGGANHTAWVPATDDNDFPIGIDSGENREPCLVVIPGVISGGVIQVNDEIKFAPSSAIPGLGVSPYTGSPRREVLGLGRLTFVHAALYRGAALSTAETVVRFQSGTVKLGFPQDDVFSFGPEAKTPLDIDSFGNIVVDLNVVRRHTDTDYETAIEVDDRFSLELLFEGDPIQLQPGTGYGNQSTYKERVRYRFAQARVSSVSSPVSTNKVLPETINLDVEQPDDGQPVVRAQVITAEDYNLSP